MHFVSAQSEEDQIYDVLTYFKENMRSSLKDQKNAAFTNFEDKIAELQES